MPRQQKSRYHTGCILSKTLDALSPSLVDQSSIAAELIPPIEAVVQHGDHDAELVLNSETSPDEVELIITELRSSFGIIIHTQFDSTLILEAPSKLSIAMPSFRTADISYGIRAEEATRVFRWNEAGWWSRRWRWLAEVRHHEELLAVLKDARWRWSHNGMK